MLCLAWYKNRQMLNLEFKAKTNRHQQAAIDEAIRTLNLLAHPPAGAHGAKRFKPVGYPKYKKNARSVEYKTSGWKLLDPNHVRFTDKCGIGALKPVGTYNLAFYSKEKIKRVRRAGGYYVQFCINVERSEPQPPAGSNVGLDVRLGSFYTDQTPKLNASGDIDLWKP